MTKKSHSTESLNKDISPFLKNDVDKPNHRPSQNKKSSPSDTLSSALPIPTAGKTELSSNHIPVTIFTGYLGAGKTTVITNLMKQMPGDYSIAWLKNEMGNTAIDTQLAKESHTTTVKEMLQGCICHVMIGQLSDALDELLASKPDRIIIETSGSATPAPIVWQIRNHNHLYVDGVITVIDAKNFKGYVNKSPSLKMQAKYTDLILINKHEDLDEITLEQNLDDLYEINLDTPKIKTDLGKVHPELIFGLDSKLFLTQESVDKEETHADRQHHAHEVEILEIRPKKLFDPKELLTKLKQLPKTDFYRIKGVFKTKDTAFIMNCSFGECTIMYISSMDGDQRLVCMGDDLKKHQETLENIFQVSKDALIFTPKEHHS